LVQQQTAALRDFGPAYDGFGSFASLRRAARLRRMSAMPLIATESVRRNEPKRCARFRLVHRSKLHPYSISSSALACSVKGTVSPSALAVLRLMISSNLVGCCTGSSAGVSPLRMRST
jgi:hypothetical protein